MSAGVCVSISGKQHCLEVADEPAEGSVPGHTHCPAAPCAANRQEMGFFVWVGVTVLLHDAPGESGGGESSMAQFHPRLREKGTESVMLLCRPGRNIPC